MDFDYHEFTCLIIAIIFSAHVTSVAYPAAFMSRTILSGSLLCESAVEYLEFSFRKFGKSRTDSHLLLYILNGETTEYTPPLLVCSAVENEQHPAVPWLFP